MADLLHFPRPCRDLPDARSPKTNPTVRYHTLRTAAHAEHVLQGQESSWKAQTKGVDAMSSASISSRD